MIHDQNGELFAIVIVIPACEYRKYHTFRNANHRKTRKVTTVCLAPRQAVLLNSWLSVGVT
jgi:hypothetical protein